MTRGSKVGSSGVLVHSGGMFFSTRGPEDGGSIGRDGLALEQAANARNIVIYRMSEGLKRDTMIVKIC